MAVQPLILVNGVTADANEVMALFDEIYSNIDETNVQAPNKTGTGPFVLGNNPTINGATIASTTLTSPTITGTVAGAATYNTPTLSGAILSGFTSGSVLFSGVGGVITQDNPNLFWNNTTKRLGVGTDTPNNRLTVSGSCNVINGDFSVSPTYSIYFDDMSDTRLFEVSPNIIRSVCGGSNCLDFASTGIEVNQSGSAAVPSIRLNDANTGFFRPAVDSVGCSSGGVENFRTNSSGEILFPAVDPPSANWANRNGIVKGYIKCQVLTGGGVGTTFGSYNVSSQSTTSSGRVRVFWNTDFLDTTYTVVATAATNGVDTGIIAMVLNQNATDATIQLSTDTGANISVATNVHIMAIGTQ